MSFSRPSRRSPSARSIAEKLVHEFPDKPRYREELAGTLTDVALALERIEPAKAEETHQTSLTFYEKLVAEHPGNIDYRIGEARCLYHLGRLMAASHRNDKADDMYRRALAVLDTRNAGATSPECLRQRAIVLSNFGDLQVTLKRSDAEVTLLGAIGAFESLVAGPSPTRDDRQNLAIAHATLGNFLVELNRPEEAGPSLRQLGGGLRIAGRRICQVASRPKAISAWSWRCKPVGWTRAASPRKRNGPWLARSIISGRPLELGQNAALYRERLGSHLLALAWIDLKLGADDEAAQDRARPAQNGPNLQPPEGLLRRRAGARARGQSDVAAMPGTTEPITTASHTIMSVESRYSCAKRSIPTRNWPSRSRPTPTSSGSRRGPSFGRSSRPWLIWAREAVAIVRNASELPGLWSFCVRRLGEEFGDFLRELWSFVAPKSERW